MTIGGVLGVSIRIGVEGKVIDAKRCSSRRALPAHRRHLPMLSNAPVGVMGKDSGPAGNGEVHEVEVALQVRVSDLLQTMCLLNNYKGTS
jgi:hypothetical protein